jgi:hypothetical protein
VEMNGYSRTQDLDGKIPVTVARAKWKPKVLKELESNHAERPTLTIEGADYVLHNYAEHQQTRAAREALAAKNAANGSKGGRPPTRKPNKTQSVSGSPATPKQSQSQSPESEIDRTDIGDDTQSSHLPERASEGPEWSEISLKNARYAGIGDHAALWRLLSAIVGPLSANGTVLLVEEITKRSKDPVKDVDKYIAVACRDTPHEVLWHYERLDLEAA